MTDIPEDVMKAAWLMAELGITPESDVKGKDAAVVIRALNRAIMAERERCAAYCEAVFVGSGGFHGEAARDTAGILAAAIRKGEAA